MIDADLTPRYSMKRMRDEIHRAEEFARREALEQAARVAETLPSNTGMYLDRRDIAKAIRALLSKMEAGK